MDFIFTKQSSSACVYSTLDWLGLAWPGLADILSTYHEEILFILWQKWQQVTEIEAALVAIVFLSCADTVQGPTEEKLYDHLLRRYNSMIRPVTNDSETLTVRLGLSLMQIIDVVRS